MRQLLFALWFFLPAGLANAAPVFAARLPGLRHLNAPLDFGKSFRGKRILGKNKTWRGLLMGMLVATVVVWFQHWLAKYTPTASYISTEVNYYFTDILWLGPLMGFGALIGDAVESFFKRLIGAEPGSSWFPFDQIDYILGGLLASVIIVRLSISAYAWVLGTWFFVHIVIVYIGYRLGIRDKPI